MKVYLGQKAGASSGGMFRVHDQLRRCLPKYDIQVVEDVTTADVIHANVALFTTIPPRLPLVVSSHGMLWEEHRWGKYADGVNRELIESYRIADVITAPSEFVAHVIRRNMLRPVSVVRHGIDPNVWLPEQTEGYVLWNKARVDAANDPGDMNKLAEMAKDISFVSTFGNKASNVKMIGKLTPTEMQEVVAKAGVYLDTPKESGGPCYGVLEAMSCGIPILSWNWGGTAEAIRHKETGYLVEVGNFDDLLEGLHYCLEHRSRLGEAARQDVIDNYDENRAVIGYIEAYERAVLAHKPRPKVSVIVTNYNLKRFISLCLSSVQQQTFADWEAVVVDDASTDGSQEIIKEFVARDDRFSYVQNSKNQHVAEARNIGVRHSKGEYILPLDGDDRLPEDALETLVGVLDADRSLDIVSGSLLLFNDTDLKRGYNNGWPNNAEYDQQIAGYNRLPYSALFRRRVWEYVGGYRHRIRTGIEDADFWTRALSFGFRAKVISPTTLLYTLRENSLRTKNPYGVAGWLSWFGWAYNTTITPFGAETKSPLQVRDVTPVVSVIIPVGPHHAPHIQGCIDSLLAQTRDDWEALVINDTGKRWFDDAGLPLTPYTAGMPFVRFIDSDEQRGVAAARNKGIAAAKTDKIIFLDVDDIAQPTMIDALIRAHKEADGWIYGDWYAYDGSKIVPSHAPDWSVVELKNKSLAPITGIYNKKDLDLVGGFDEDAPGWEDWDLQLKLLEKGICGTRVRSFLIAYHMVAGKRREENFAIKNTLLQYIKTKHKHLLGDNTVACSGCGGKKTVVPKGGAARTEAVDTNMVLIQYTGAETQHRTLKSPTQRGVRYRFNNKKPFFVFKSDADFFLRKHGFVLVPQDAPIIQDMTSSVPLVSDTRAEEIPSFENLMLSTKLVNILRENFPDIASVATASDASLLSLRGIGSKALSDIREALQNV